ncbi:hypothetical protein GCM10009099_18510 [Caenispirillum bisanense]
MPDYNGLRAGRGGGGAEAPRAAQKTQKVRLATTVAKPQPKKTPLMQVGGMSGVVKAVLAAVDGRQKLSRR